MPYHSGTSDPPSSIYSVPGPAPCMLQAWQIMPTMRSCSFGLRFPSPRLSSHLHPYPYLEIAGAVETDLDTTHGAHGIMLGHAGRLLGVGLLASSKTAHWIVAVCSCWNSCLAESGHEGSGRVYGVEGREGNTRSVSRCGTASMPFALLAWCGMGREGDSEAAGRVARRSDTTMTMMTPHAFATYSIQLQYRCQLSCGLGRRLQHHQDED